MKNKFIANITTNKDILIKRITERIIEEKRLVGKIISQVKLAKKNPRIRLNIEEKQLRVHLNEVIKKWEQIKVSKVVNSFLEEIKKSLKKQENITLRGYFSLKVHRSEKRRFRNPQTGGLMTIGAKNRISFRTGQKLKKEIN